MGPSRVRRRLLEQIMQVVADEPCILDQTDRAGAKGVRDARNRASFEIGLVAVLLNDVGFSGIESLYRLS